MKKKDTKIPENSGMSVIEKENFKKELEEYINIQLIKKLDTLNLLNEKISKIEEVLSSTLKKPTKFKLKEEDSGSELEEELSYFDRIINFSEDAEISPQEMGDFTDDEAIDENIESLDIKKFEKPQFIEEENPSQYDANADISIYDDTENQDEPTYNYSLSSMLPDDPSDNEGPNEIKLSDMISENDTEENIEDEKDELSESSSNDETKPLSIEDKYGDILGEDTIAPVEEPKKGFDLASFVKTEPKIDEEDEEETPEVPKQKPKKGLFDFLKKA